MSSRWIIIGSLILALLVVLASLPSLIDSGFYFRETLNWQAQSAGQDVIDLIIVVPTLVTLAILTRNHPLARLMWGGVVTYVLYTFIIYSFALHFNSFFLIYCWALGLSVYLFAHFCSHITNEETGINYNNKWSKVIGIYFLLVSVLFYLLWLSEIVPALTRGEAPSSLAEVGLLTNPVHVLDLGVVLPGIFVVGAALLKERNWAQNWIPVVLTFFALMDITIGLLVVKMKIDGVGSGDISVTIAMGVLAIVSVGLLFRHQQIDEA